MLKSIQSIQIPSGKQPFFLNRLNLSTPEQQDRLQSNVSHIFICDVSGSMTYDLPMMRKQLCNEISSLVKPQDDVTIIWFSGSGEAGIIKERVQVSDVKQLLSLQDAINRWLQPVGLTSFVKPIELTKEVISNIKRETPNNLTSVVFLTDGGMNVGSKEDMLILLSEVADNLSASSFIEYGHYCDSALIKEMAEITGGRQIFCADFNAFEPEFRSLINNGCASKRVAFSIAQFKDDMSLQMVFQSEKATNTIITHSTRKKDIILVSEDTQHLYLITKKALGDVVSIESDPGLALVCFVPLFERMMYDWSEPIIYNIGDIDLLSKYVGAYGKQKLNEFKVACFDILFNGADIYKNGYNPAAKPNEKAYCIIDMISDLVSNADTNKVYPLHEAFEYERIGAKAEIKIELNEDIKARLAAAKTKREADLIMLEVNGPEFEIVNKDQAFPLTELVWNETRANLSFRVRYAGVVKLPKNDYGLVEVPSHIYRTYTIIKDGILNVKSLPVTLDTPTFLKLQEQGVIGKDEIWNSGEIFVAEFGHLPIINRSMVQKISAVDLANLEYELFKVQSSFKVLNYFDKMLSPKVNTESTQKYSAEAAKYLQSIGVTDFNGFSPKTELVKTGDVYMAPVLETKIEKLSNIPKVEDVQKKMKDNYEKEEKNKKPLTISESLVLPTLQQVELVNGDVKAKLVKEGLKTFSQIKHKLMNEIAGQKFSLILSKRWFKEFKGFDDNEIVMKFDDNELKVKFDFKEKEISL